MKLDELKKKKILILGFGKEGRDALLFLRKIFPEKIIGIADKNVKRKTRNTKLRWHLGKNYLKALENYDVVIKSPGIPIHLPEVERAFNKEKIKSPTDIFLDNCRGLVVGVTGTKGKGTTVCLIYKILKEAGLPAYLVGNIGKPALSLLLSDKPDNIYVYEMSSHQLFHLKKSPKIAVFLNIYPDHLDYFKNFREYVSAKSNIVKHQGKDDFLIYNRQDKTAFKIAKTSKANKIPIQNYSHILRSVGIKKPPLSLLGEHNLLNIAAAFQVSKIFSIPKTKIVKAIKKFEVRVHRLEYIQRFCGIDFYNDSASTLPESTIAAIKTLGKNVETIILGGSEKGADFKNLAEVILSSKIKNTILFPPSGQRIWQAIKEKKGKKLPNHFFAGSMSNAVQLAYQYTQKGKICLLSPASASFGIFKDYRQRGDLFKKFVKKYARQ